MSSPLPERRQDYADPTTGQHLVPAHHRPPNVIYDDYGRPHHVVLGQPSPPPVFINMPEPKGLDPALQRLIVITFLIIAVVVVCTGALCAVVVLMGGTLIGIIGAVGQNLTSIMLCLVGVIAAVGWAATKMNIKPGKSAKKR